MLRKLRDAVLRGTYSVLDDVKLLDHFQPWLSGLGLIFVFHHVVSDYSEVFNPSLTICSQDLENIFRLVKSRGWDIVSIDQLSERLTKRDSTRPFVCFTFDDGYADNFNVALPVFRRHNAPMCVNITTGYVDRSTSGWWDALVAALTQRDEIEFCDNGSQERLSLATNDDKISAYRQLSAVIFRDIRAGRPPLDITWRRNGLDPIALSDECFVRWEELRKFANDPLVSIGAHSVNHLPLALLSENAAGDEIEQSRRILEEKLGVKVSHFAYPFGTSNFCGPREFRLVRELGFSTAVTTRCCNVFPAHTEDLMSLPRKSVEGGDASAAAVRARLYGEDLWLRKTPRVVLG